VTFKLTGAKDLQENCACLDASKTSERCPIRTSSSFPCSPLARFFSLLHPVSTTMPGLQIWPRQYLHPLPLAACCYPNRREPIVVVGIERRAGGAPIGAMPPATPVARSRRTVGAKVPLPNKPRSNLIHSSLIGPDQLWLLTVGLNKNH
jgi:hypothetical protein